MTTEATQIDTLKTWWDKTEFAGKEFCELKENGELALRKTKNINERTIATLTPENAEPVLKALVEKFPEIQGRVKEVEQEWNNSEDKLKLIGKVARLKDYLQHTNAVGDFDSLTHQVMEWDSSINQLVEENHKQKVTLVEKAEKIAGEGESWKEITQEFKEIGDQWKHIGYVDKNRNDELWNRLETAKNKFFERKRQHQEEQEKEMLRNLDLKMEIVDKAEALVNSENFKEATDQFRTLMDEWKATGRTMQEKNEDLWNRFITAKNVFFDRKRAHFETIQAEQEVNYTLKQALVEKAEAIKDSTEWNKTTQAYAELTEEWKKIGRVPLEKGDELWDRFNAAKEVFFTNKRQHTETVRVSQEDNYAQKLALAKRAEELKHSNQWREATEEMNELMSDWKKIGQIPREYGNALWEQFIGARKFFFERKDADREKRKQFIEKQNQHRQDRAKSFLSQLEAELKEEQERLDDFRTALENVTPGNKEEELRAHLTKLIAQTETKIKHKEEKIKDVHKQNAESKPKESKKAEVSNETNEEPGS